VYRNCFRIINIDSQTGAIIRIILKFVVFSTLRLSFHNTDYERVMEKHGVGDKNSNDERLVEFCAINDLII
jgi:hypothetical protein